MISQETINMLQKELGLVQGTNSTTYPHEEKKLKSFLGDAQDLFSISNAIIAGGAITSLFTNNEINDVDVYFRNAEDLSKFLCGAFTQECGYLKLMHMTDRSVLLTDCHDLKIQLIVYKFFDSPQEVFDSFDFSVNMGAYDFKEKNFVLDERFLRHNAQRYVEINTKTDYPLVSVLRIDKYRNKGYKVSKPQLLALLMRVAQLDLQDWDQVLDHIGGMYGVDPEKIFDKSKEFSMQEVIDQLQLLETVDSHFEGNQPSFKELAEKLDGKLTSQTKEALVEFKWSTDKFLEIAFSDEVFIEVYQEQPIESSTINTTKIDDNYF